MKSYRLKTCWLTTPIIVGSYIMLRTFAHSVACCYMLFRVVGSCCIRLHTTANTDATTPNIVVPLYSPVTSSNASVHECSWEKGLSNDTKNG